VTATDDPSIPESDSKIDGAPARAYAALDGAPAHAYVALDGAPAHAYARAPKVAVSWGEIMDKITILEIKEKRLTAPEALANVRRELAALMADAGEVYASLALTPLINELKSVNLALWDIEDRIRAKEAANSFDDEFVQLARSVYIRNDARGAIKKRINRITGSEITEEKEYAPYGDANPRRLGHNREQGMTEAERMDPIIQLPIVRRAYAKQIAAMVGVKSPALEAAFAAVPREAFLGAGPWQVMRYSGAYVPTPNDDPVYLYTDALIGIIPERKINNGQPSLHALLLGAAAPARGEHVVHIGTGTGYYTAIMAEMVGPSGRVTGIEYDPQLAARAKSHLAGYPNVTIIAGDGTTASFDMADVIYANAGTTSPAASWLDRLAEGGRLILPLTTDASFGKIEAEKTARRGAVFRIERWGDTYPAKWLSPVAIFPCAGNRDEASEQALAAAFEKGGAPNVERLYRKTEIPDALCWLRGKDWCLAFG
jgi:protein-L-isoaspartate(D-aspartate) O-methyltransferase